MKTISIKMPKNFNGHEQEWEARYAAEGSGDVRVLRIEARSAIDIVVAKTAQKSILGPMENYYIASPNFGVAIPGINSLQETFWITEQLINRQMPAADAVTVAQVLKDMGDF